MKLDARALTPAEDAALETWLEADIRHPGALGRAIATLVRVDRLGALGTNTPSGLTAQNPPFWTRRRLVIGSSAATGLAAAAAAGFVFWNGATPQHYVTEIGETRIVNLADGSIVTLNTNTKLAVSFSKQSRDVELLQGEALFRVAKDKTRPFTVTASDTKVRAVGTAFNVSLLPKRPIQILVEEGVVEVTQHNMTERSTIRASAGIKATVSDGRPIVARPVSAVQTARDLAWQHGQLEFTNETLTDAAEEFSRYSGTRITVDPAIADRTITGSFAAKDPVGFAKAAAAVLDLQFTVEENQVRISR